MRGNSFGHILTLTTFGESHGSALGAVVDGCPAGIALSANDIAGALRRRRPGQSALTSQRAESDVPEILSGIFEGRTLGTPIAVIVRNTDARSEDYDSAHFRPGHADQTWQEKYGIRDHRGGGRSSGRETLARVIGGAIAERILPQSVSIVSFSRAIGTVDATDIPDAVARESVDASAVRCPDPAAAERMEAEIARCSGEGDSVGGIVELRIGGLPAGLGEPVFRKTKSELAAALMSIGAVIGVTLGDAAGDVRVRGTAYHGMTDSGGRAVRAHGMQGGITNGGRITMRVFVKPTGTTGAQAKTGRHDPCIVPRIIPVIDAMAALVLADLWLAARLDRASI